MAKPEGLMAQPTLSIERRRPLDILSTVVEGGYCIGCGVCAVVDGSPITIEMNDRGYFQAALRDDSPTDQELAARIDSVCPFSASATDENRIGATLFASHAEFDTRIGFHVECYAGHVTEGRFREQGSSGGIAKWILHELFQHRLIDYAIHVEPASMAEDGTLFTYRVATSESEILRGSRAAYYPVEMSGALQFLKENPGRYAITGVPCFIKAVRLLAMAEPGVAGRVRFCLGIICGHLKSHSYAEMIAWQMGVPPGDLEGIDFRTKIPGLTAREKGVTVVSRSRPRENIPPKRVQDIFGTKYPYGFFQYPACDFCDDVLAETADVAVGDAWLPEYIAEGNSIVVVRNELIHGLVQRAVAEGRLALDPVGPDTVAMSQSGGLRHRREGLAFRLHTAVAEGRWVPPKRVAPAVEHIPPRRRAIYRMRTVMASRSTEAFHKAKKAGDFEVFHTAMRRLTRRYELVSMTWRRAAGILFESIRLRTAAARIYHRLRRR